MFKIVIPHLHSEPPPPEVLKEQPDRVCSDYAPRRQCWEFGLLGIWATIFFTLGTLISVYMACGLCTKTSRKLYHHTITGIGIFVLVEGANNVWFPFPGSGIMEAMPVMFGKPEWTVVKGAMVIRNLLITPILVRVWYGAQREY